MRLGRAADWLRKQVFSAQARQTIYVTPSGSTIIDAAPVKHSYPLVDSATGLMTQIDVHDWLVRVDAISGEPTSDDLIRETVGSLVYEYAVLPMGDRPCAELWDTARSVWLIHTKLMSRS